MTSFWQQLDDIPVTLVIAIAFVTLAFLTDPFSPTPKQLMTYGWLTPFLVSEGEPWRLLSHAFLHGGIVHLAFNTWALLAFGPALERSLGSVRLAVLYVVASLGGGLAACLIYDVFQPVVGGSGALFGMLGAIVALQMRSGRHLLSFLEYEGPRRLLALIAVNLVLGFLLPFVSNTAHVGGLLTGFVLTFLWLAPGRQPSRNLLAWRAATAALFAGLAFYSVMPVTRYDWLWNRSVAESRANRAEAMQRAAAMSYYGTWDASEADVQRFYDRVIDPPTPKKRGG